MTDNYKTLLEKINNRSLTVGVLGLGYVGLPLAVTFALEKVNVLGFEKSAEKVKLVNSGSNYIGDVADKDLEDVVGEGSLEATEDFSRIKECDAVLMCLRLWTGSKNRI